MMIHVCYGLMPCLVASIYFFGLKSLALAALVTVIAIATEGWFTLRRRKPITSAVLVTSLIFTLSLPPTVPFWIAAVGIVFGVMVGKMVFGGFGFNTFNPAMVGRCFIYVSFPIVMTNVWTEPFSGRFGGFLHWTASADAVTRATPLKLYEAGKLVPWQRLFWGAVPGSLGETAAWLIILGGLYIIIRKSASWRLAVSCLLGGTLTAGFLWIYSEYAVPDPITSLLSASFLLTAPKTHAAQWIYGFLTGGLAMVIRKFSGFAEGMMFSVLFMNTFASIMDLGVKGWKARGKTT